MAGPDSLLRFLQMSDGSVEDVRLFLERDSSSINKPDNLEETPLFYLLKSPKCSRDIVALLLEFGASTDSRNSYGETPLLYAVRSVKDQDVITVLIGKTSNVNVRDNGGYSILCHALNSHLPIKLVENLLMKAGSVQACIAHATVWQCFLDECSWRSIKYKTEFSTVLKLLIEADFDVTKVDPADGRSPLCLVLLAGAGVDIIKLLFNRGCSFDDCTKHRSPIMCLTDGCSGALLKAEVVTLLLKMGASLEGVDSNGYTALQRSLKYRVYEVDAIKILLDYARMNEELSNIKHERFGNLLHFAVDNPSCKLSIANLLLMNGVRCDEINVYGSTPLHNAMGDRTKVCIVSTLLRSGSPVNTKCNYGDTPLRLAVACHSPVNVLFTLMAAGSFIEELTDVYSGVPLLEHVLKEYRKCGIDSCKKFIKFAFIENPNCQIEGLLESHSDKEELTSFAEDCKMFAKKMEAVNIGQLTSIEFIKGYYSRNVAGDCKTTLHLQLDQLLKAISESQFYNFYDVICYKISSLMLMEKLEQLSVYTMKNCCDNPCVEHIIELNNECKVRIVRYVTKRDLLCFVLAFLFRQ